MTPTVPVREQRVRTRHRMVGRDGPGWERRKEALKGVWTHSQIISFLLEGDIRSTRRRIPETG